MLPAQVHMPVFESTNPNDVRLSFQMLRELLHGLARSNLHYLNAFPNTPSLYQSGVRYVPENRSENWLMIPYLLKTKAGDCEDLAAWRTAEYWRQGIRAVPDIRARNIGTKQRPIWRAHAFVRLPDGRLDDPSLRLGMKGID